MRNLIERLLKDEAGVTAIEYGLIAALIAIVVIAGVRAAGSKVGTTFTNIAANM